MAKICHRCFELTNVILCFHRIIGYWPSFFSREITSIAFVPLYNSMTQFREMGGNRHRRGALRLVISSRMGELKIPRDLERVLFVVAHMVDALSHGAVLRRPPQMSLAEAKEEAVRAILAYLRA
jgi:hypothetical protein